MHRRYTTVPISMIHSRWATELKDNYGTPQVLPSVMVRQENGDPYGPVGWFVPAWRALRNRVAGSGLVRKRKG